MNLFQISSDNGAVPLDSLVDVDVRLPFRYISVDFRRQTHAETSDKTTAKRGEHVLVRFRHFH